MRELLKRFRIRLDENTWALVVLALGSSAVFSQLDAMGHLLRGIRFRLEAEIVGMQSDPMTYSQSLRELSIILEYPLQRTLELCFPLLFAVWVVGMAATLLVAGSRRLHLLARVGLFALLFSMLIVVPALRPVP